MLFLRPSPAELLALAVRVIGNWDPHKNSDAQRDEVVLAGQAAAVAIREIFGGRDVERATALDISQFYSDINSSASIVIEMNVKSLWSRLAEDIRSGHFDDETMSPSIHELLTTIARRSLQVTNPTYFKPPSEWFD